MEDKPLTIHERHERDIQASYLKQADSLWVGTGYSIVDFLDVVANLLRAKDMWVDVAQSKCDIINELENDYNKIIDGNNRIIKRLERNSKRNMKKPEKLISGLSGVEYCDGYNKACEDWKAYIDWLEGTYKRGKHGGAYFSPEDLKHTKWEC